MCDSCLKQEEIPRSYSHDFISVHPTDPSLMRICNSDGDGTYRELIMLNEIDHPNIPKIRDVIRSGNYIHYSMNRCVPLEVFVRYVDLKTKTKLFMVIGSAVSYLCQKGVYHQNIHPPAIMVDPITLIPYLMNYTYSNDEFTVRAAWIDPWINQEYYTTWIQPTREKMISSNLWSLGMLGIWLLIDNNVYDWINENADDETINVAYLVKGRFGFGIRQAGLDLDGVPESVIGLVDVLISNPVRRKVGLQYFDAKSDDKSRSKYWPHPDNSSDLCCQANKIYKSLKPKMVLKLNPHTTNLF